MNPHLNELTHEIVGAAIEVHRHLGPGLLESSYRECLCWELSLRAVSFAENTGFRWNTKVSGWTVVIE